MTKQELKKYVEEYEIDYDYEKAYCDIRNACIDYENDSQDKKRFRRFKRRYIR